MYPASSCCDTGFASSAMRSDAVFGDALVGIKDKYCPVMDGLRPEGLDWLGRGRDGEPVGVRYWFGGLLVFCGVETVGWMGCGFGRGGGETSSIGMLKQQKCSFCCFGLGRAILVGLCLPGLPGPLCLDAFSDFVGPMRPRRSASVSMLVRSSRIGVWDVFGPGLEWAEMLACSLCCQQ